MAKPTLHLTLLTAALRTWQPTRAMAAGCCGRAEAPSWHSVSTPIARC